MSQSSLQRLFKHFLTQVPVSTIKSHTQVHLLIDGTYFPGDLCLVIYFDYDIGFTQLYRLTDKERYKEMREDLLNLKKLGVEIESITCDGHRALLKAIKKVYPDAIIQRCLVHIKRQCRIWLTQKPQSQAAKELLPIVYKITAIETYPQSSMWLLEFYHWHKHYENFVNEKSFTPETGRYWYKHKMVHRACALLIKAIPDMFHYLDVPAIPNTTNKLEGFFGHLKDKLKPHRGLSKSNRKNFIKWYLHFKNKLRGVFFSHKAQRISH